MFKHTHFTCIRVCPHCQTYAMTIIRRGIRDNEVLSTTIACLGCGRAVMYSFYETYTRKTLLVQNFVPGVLTTKHHDDMFSWLR